MGTTFSITSADTFLESVSSCDVVYKYSPDDGTLQAADITWTAVHVRYNLCVAKMPTMYVIDWSTYSPVNMRRWSTQWSLMMVWGLL